MRLATAFGVTKRLRFDLAINAMTLNAMNSNPNSLLKMIQWRPFVSCNRYASILHFCEIKTNSLNSKIFDHLAQIKNAKYIPKIVDFIQEQSR